MKKVVIIGSGWYGCYAALLLQDFFDVLIIEKNNDIFSGSSYYNQNRLHLGYHYSRNYTTRKLCKDGYDLFYDKFNKHNIIDKLDKNYYLISNDSTLDFNTINSIFKYEDFKFKIIQNDMFSNIDNNILLVDECVINHKKTKEFFKMNVKCKILFNKKVDKVNYDKNKCIVIMGDDVINCDIVINCTYNELDKHCFDAIYSESSISNCINNSINTYSCNTQSIQINENKKYIYEKTLSLLYEKTSNTNFDAFTIIDGDFLSLYPRDYNKNIYTLTDVEFTPLIKSSVIDDIINYNLSENELNEKKNKMTHKLKYYYHDFDKHFKYKGYFLSNKSKLLSNSDSRECNIENIENKIFSFNCGKITGIFIMEEYLKNNLHI